MIITGKTLAVSYVSERECTYFKSGVFSYIEEVILKITGVERTRSDYSIGHVLHTEIQ